LTKEQRTKSKALLLCILFLGWIIYVLMEFQFIKWITNEKHIQMQESETAMSAFQVFLLTVFMYPLIEELIFRLPLRVKKSNVVLSLVVAAWFFTFQSELLDIKTNTFIGYKLFLPLTLSVIVLFLFYKTQYAQSILDRLNGRFYMSFVLTSAITFTMAHFSGIIYDSLIYALLFLLIVHFSFALFLSYVRIKFNFGVALTFHILNNLIPYVIIIYYGMRHGLNPF
jgi:hypothetical protein